jgi:hypothetical protein
MWQTRSNDAGKATEGSVAALSQYMARGAQPLRAPRVFQSTNAGGRQGDMTETMWKYEQLRAGKIYNQVMFNTREEAESFAAQMNRVEPDLFWRIEPVEARLWWN